MAQTTAGLDVIDRTVHKTNEWVKEIGEELGWDSKHLAFQSMRAVLHTLRDRLPIQEAAHLGEQLLTLVRGIYYESWKPNIVPIKDRKIEDFLDRIPPYFPPNLEMDPEMVVRSVFHVVKKHVSGGEIDDVLSNMPQELRGLWD